MTFGGSRKNQLVAYGQASQLEIHQEQDDKLIWNPAVNAYVDKKMYLKALETRDPTKKGYKGVSPNFGGGNVKGSLDCAPPADSESN